MKKIFTLIIVSLSFFVNKIYSQTVYSSIASGAWNSGTVWETFPDPTTALAASPGTGTASSSTTNPTGSHFVLIRPGHTITMGGANRGCRGIIIQSGGKLWANESTARRLQIGASGTYPVTDTVQVDGIMGGANDGIFIETGVTAATVNVTGSGSIDILRIRTIGGAGGSGVLNFNINTNVNLWQAANYALTVVYNPALTDNYTMTIAPGKTVTIKAADGTFHNSQNAATYGIYKYVINGTLDVSANTQATNNTSANIIAPNPATSKVSLYIDGGTLKLGASFKADTSNTSPQSLGVLDFKIINGGVVDGSQTSNFRMGKTSDGAGGFRDLVFGVDATSSLKLLVGASQVKFGVALNNTATNSAYITNSGIADVFTVALKGTIDNAPPTSNVVNRQWTISEAVPGGTVGTIGLSWVTADQSAGFNPAGTVSILRWTGTAYEPHAATVTGSGTANDPYVATATGFVAFSPFIVANFAALPISFENIKAYQKSTGVQIDWSIANDNADTYVIERSADGSSFASVGNVNAQSNGTATTNYSWYDATPLTGNNFYRIKAVDRDGSIKYTSVMKVTINGGKPALLVSPNPVKGHQLNIQLTNIAKGTYTINLYNISGQKVFTDQIKSEGGSSSQTLQVPSTVKGGTYNLQLNNGTDVKLNKTIVIE